MKPYKELTESDNIKRPKVALLMFPNREAFDHRLPLPDSLSKTGGYRIAGTQTPEYSPVDLSIALIESYILGEKLKNLESFFITHKKRESECIIRILIFVNEQIVNKSVVEWKQYVAGLPRVDPMVMLLYNNAPFTMKY